MRTDEELEEKQVLRRGVTRRTRGVVAHLKQRHTLTESVMKDGGRFNKGGRIDRSKRGSAVDPGIDLDLFDPDHLAGAGTAVLADGRACHRDPS